jgi:hypothetical protein
MAFMNEFLDRDSAERSSILLREFPHPSYRLMSLRFAGLLRSVFLAPSVDTLHDEIIHGTEMAAI